MKTMTTFEDCSHWPVCSVALGHLQEVVRVPFKMAVIFHENYSELP